MNQETKNKLLLIQQYTEELNIKLKQIEEIEDKNERFVQLIETIDSFANNIKQLDGE